MKSGIKSKRVMATKAKPNNLNSKYSNNANEYFCMAQKKRGIRLLLFRM